MLLPLLLLQACAPTPDALLLRPIDVDRDGRTDLWLPGQGRLLWNSGNLEFREATVSSGLEGTQTDGPSIWEDFDLDGDLDLLIGGPTGVRLLVQGPGLRFQEGRFPELPSGPVEGAEWLLDQAGGRPSLLLTGPTGLALFAPVGTSGFAPALIPAFGPASVVFARAAVSACAKSIKDQAGGVCLKASSVPELGLLYPISQALFVAPDGRVGMGTTTPTERLSVEGVVESRSGGFRFPDGSLQATAQLVGPIGPQGPEGPQGDPGTTSWLGLTDVPAELLDGDDDTTYTAGVGTKLVGTQLSFDTAFGDARYWNETQTLSGDLTGTPGAALVGGIQGRAVNSAAPQVGQILKWNGFSWSPNSDNNTDTTYTAGTGLALSGTTFSIASAGVGSAQLAADANSLDKVSGGLVKTGGGALMVNTTDQTGRLHVRHASSTSSPHLRLTQDGASAFSRIGFSNVDSPETWMIAGGLGASPATDRLNFFHSVAGDVLSIAGNGRVGIATSAPIAALHVNGGIHLQGSAQDITIPNGDNLQIGHFDGTTYTERLRVNSAGTLVLPGNADFEGNLTLDGNLTLGGALTIPTTTRSLTLSAAGFSTDPLDPGGILADQTGPYFSFLPGGLSPTAWASVALPHGAVVTRLEALVQDSSSTGNLQVRLYRTPFSTSGTKLTMADIATSGTTASLSKIQDTTISFATIDTDSNFYWIEAQINPPAVDLLPLRLYAVRIEYTVTSGLP